MIKGTVSGAMFSTEMFQFVGAIQRIGRWCEWGLGRRRRSCSRRRTGTTMEPPTWETIEAIRAEVLIEFKNKMKTSPEKFQSVGRSVARKWDASFPKDGKPHGKAKQRNSRASRMATFSLLGTGGRRRRRWGPKGLVVVVFSLIRLPWHVYCLQEDVEPIQSGRPIAKTFGSCVVVVCCCFFSPGFVLRAMPRLAVLSSCFSFQNGKFEELF